MATVSEVEVRITGNDRNLQTTLNRADDNVRGFARQVGDHLRRMDLFDNLVRGVFDFGKNAIQTSIEFESAFAGVVKTVDGTDEQLASLRDTIADLATNSDLSALDDAFVTLSGIAATGGQLGISVDALDEFTLAIGALSVAAESLDAESAAVFAAQFANITGFDVAENIDNLASAIAYLGNNSATSEAQIATTANRLAQIAALNFDPEQILGYSAALASLGLSPELGGTNLAKTLRGITTAVAEGGPELSHYAEIAGMTAEEFSNISRQNPARAFNAFLVGLRSLDPEEQILALQELGIVSQEQQRTILTLAEGYDTVAESLINANEGWNQGNAHLIEAGARADTTAGQMNTLKNNVAQLGDSLGQNFLPAINDVVAGMTDMVQGEGGFDQVAVGVAEFLDQIDDLMESTTGWQILDQDFSEGIGAFIGAWQMMPEALSIIWDNMTRGFERWWLETKLSWLENIAGLREMVMTASGGVIDIAPEVSLDVTNTLIDLTNLNMAEQFEQQLRQDMADGAINLDDMTLNNGMVDIPLENVVQIDPEGLAEAIGPTGRQAVEDALRMAIAEGDQGAIEVLTPIANELDIDLEAVRNDMADTIAAESYEAQATVDVTVLPGFVDMSAWNAGFYAQVNAGTAAAAANVNANATAGAPAGSTGGTGGSAGEFSDVPAFHGGGVFFHPGGEGLAMLRSGEAVLTPEETKALRRSGRGGGGGNVYNVQSYGQHPSELTRMIDRSRADSGR